jgi:DNA repair exonuclease SbcCD ATPase subunit
MFRHDPLAVGTCRYQRAFCRLRSYRLPILDRSGRYGKECTDLQGVDYDAISMLNVSATQELAKQLETLKQQNSDLQNEAKRLTAVEEQESARTSEQGAAIAALKAANEKLSAVESENTELKAEMEVLKKAVATIQEKENSGVRRVALQQ